MDRRKFLAGIGSLTAGSAVAMGTGAFSYVRADRDMSVSVESDDSAYLKLDGSTSEYASGASDGQLELQFDGSNGQNGSGLNADADSRFDNVFKIKNQGTNTVRVSIQDADPDVVGFYEGTDFSEAGLLNGGPGHELPELAPGDEISVSMIFWLRDNDNTESDIPNEIGIVAEEA